MKSKENNGVLTAGQVKDALIQVSQSKDEQSTQWSLVYEQSSSIASYYFNGDYSKSYSYKLGEK